MQPEHLSLLQCVQGRIACADQAPANPGIGQSDLSLDLLLKNLPGMVYRCLNDATWTMQFISAGVERLTGYRPEQLIGNQSLSYAEIIHPDDRGRVRQEVQAAIDAGHAFQLTYRIMTAQGSEKWVWEQGNAIHDQAGKPLALEGYVTDITERKRAQDALSESEERFKSMARATNDAVWDWDLASDKIWWNEGVETLFGLPFKESEPSSRTWSERIHPEDRERVMRGIDSVVKDSSRNWSDEYRFMRKDGSYAYVLDRGIVIRDPKGRAVRMVGGMTDLSDRKQAEEEARRNVVQRAAIVRIQKEIASADLDMQAVMNLMAERARQLTGACGGMIELIEGEEIVSRAAAGTALIPTGMRLKMESSLSGSAVRGGTVLYCGDTETDERVDRVASRLIAARAIIVAPLRSGAQVIGVLKVISSRPGAFGKDDVSNLQILAESLGAVIERHRAVEKLRASEAQYRLLFDSNPHSMCVYDTETLRILAVNRSAVVHYGYSEQEFRQMTIMDILSKEDGAFIKPPVRGIVGQLRNVGLWRHRKKDGSIIHVEAWSDAIDFNGCAARMVLINDVTERLRAEHDLARVSRARQMLGACNEALIRIDNEAALLEEICRVAVEIGGYYIAWVGFARKDEEKSIVPVAHFGECSDFLKRVKISWSEDKASGRGPAGRTIRAGKTTIVEDLAADPTFQPWMSLARSQGYRSAVWLPLRDRERTFGLLTLYSVETAHISSDEVKLLEELADNLAFGINNIRTENERRRLEMTAVKVAAALSASTGAEFFKQLAVNMAEAVGAQAAFVAQLLPGEPPAARVVTAVVDGAVKENFDYPLAGTPCEQLLGATESIVPDRVAERFSQSPSLAAMGAQAYVGRRLDGFDGRPVGLLFVLFRQPLADAGFITSTLQIFAARAASEMERREADARIREQASLLDKAKDAIVVRGIGDNRVRFWNKGAERLYGWTQEEVIGRSIEELLYDDPSMLQAATRIVLRDGEWSGEITERCKDGTYLTVEANWTLVRDESGQPQSIFAIKTDITQRKAAEHEIQYLAFYDPLTRLPNRLLLIERLQHALAVSVRSREKGALLFIDLDNFKTLNDTFGHDMGDLLLQQVAQRLTACVRESDTVARLGGDEFVVMLQSLSAQPDDATSRARAVGEKILAALNMPFQLGAVEHHSTPSIGVTLFDHCEDNVGEVLKRADLAMYHAKGAGRNAMRFFDPDMQAAVSARMALETDLRQSLLENEFVLHYQPQVDCSGLLTGMEALLRWQHPQRGMVLPGDFIPLAEDTGLILPLGRCVLEAACAQLAAWGSNPATADLDLAVNVSARQFRHPDFVDQVLGALDRNGANPARLKLELTESLLVEDLDIIISRMTALKRKGVGFSLDDFGTGYSSLFYLKHLPLDQLKIDRSFIRDVLTDPNDAAIVHTIITLGKSLGLAVIAEGVESEEQRVFLALNGCAAYQGNLFGKPISSAQLEAFLRRHGRA